MWIPSNAKAWPDAVRLAFGFLDVDRDGFLSASDLLAHVAGEDGRAFGNGRKWYTATWPMDKRLKTFGDSIFSMENN